MWNSSGDIADKFRDEVLGLPVQTQKENSAARKNTLVLYGYGRHVIPQPEDWPPNFHTTGYWFLLESQTWQPPRELLDFLEASDRPICIGFGSMAVNDATALTHLFIETATKSGERAVFLSGWSGMKDVDLPSNIFQLPLAPHEWLFPRVKAVIHHGGAGATAATLRAGVPVLAIPPQKNLIILRFGESYGEFGGSQGWLDPFYRFVSR